MIGTEAEAKLADLMAEFIEREKLYLKGDYFSIKHAAKYMAEYARLGLKEYMQLQEAAKITESDLSQLSGKLRRGLGE